VLLCVISGSLSNQHKKSIHELTRNRANQFFCKTVYERILFMRAWVLLLVLVLPVLSDGQGRRIGPPDTLKCDRSDLTLYDGSVLAYRRRKGKTFLRVRTSFDTTEEVNIVHPGTDDPSKFYLINGEPFRREDWKRIEVRKGVLKNGLQVNIWVCRDKPSIQPVVDWKP
jgi:hypothetical protein